MRFTAYTMDVHMAFTQTVLAVQTLTLVEVDDLLNELNAKSHTQVTPEEQMVRSNLFLQKLGRTLAKERDIVSEEWVLVCSSRNAPRSFSRAGLGDDKVDMILRNLFLADKNYLCKVQSLCAKNVTPADIEAFAREGWLGRNSEGLYYPSTRLVLDASNYMEEKWGQETLFKCPACDKHVIFGRFCTRDDCRVRLHRRCYEPYYRRHNFEENKCCDCGSDLAEANNSMAL